MVISQDQAGLNETNGWMYLLGECPRFPSSQPGARARPSPSPPLPQIQSPPFSTRLSRSPVFRSSPPLPVTGNGVPRTTQFPNRAAHPIHLHGHDFAILAQSETPWQVGRLELNTVNPPRRDVALLPGSGYLVLAFKADNPGAWLMHCHIAWHASGGLALQVLEDRSRIVLSEADERQLKDTCEGWKAWNATAQIEQDDSGI